jgi:hypothetical protein
VLFDVVQNSLDEHPALSGSTVSRQLHLAKWRAGMPETTREKDRQQGKKQANAIPSTINRRDQSALNQIDPQILRERLRSQPILIDL